MLGSAGFDLEAVNRSLSEFHGLPLAFGKILGRFELSSQVFPWRGREFKSRRSDQKDNIGELGMSKRVISAIAALSISGGAALAQEVKVGVVLPYTGIGAEFARQMDRGMELYLKLNPDQVKPYTITFIKRDSKAPSGADAKIAVQELLTQDKVDALAGWVYSPDAIASAPLVTAGKKLAVIMNAATAFITSLAPDFVRTSFSMWHAGYAL